MTVLTGLSSLLSVPTLYRAVQQFRLAKSNWVTNWLLTGRPILTTENDEVLSFHFNDREYAGKIGRRGSPPGTGPSLSITRTQEGVLRIHDKTTLNASWYQGLSRDVNLRDIDPNGETTLARAISGLSDMQTRTLDKMTAHSIFTGHIFADSNNNILTASVDDSTGAVTDPSGAVFDYDFGIPDNRRGDLDGLISALWSDPDTDILQALVDIRHWALMNKLPMPDQITMPETLLPKLLLNTQYQNWAKYNGAAQAAALQGQLTPGLFGWKWAFVPAQPQETSAASTTVIDLWPENRALITSSQESTIDITEGCERFAPGADTYLVGGSLSDLDAGVVKMFGDFGYAVATKGTDPGLTLHQGWNRGWSLSRACILTPVLFG